jgi:phosphoserine phosphatase RsbU/P
MTGVPAGGDPSGVGGYRPVTGDRPTAVAEKLRRIQAVTDAALSRLGVEDLLDELLDRTMDLLAADIAAILLLDADGQELVPTATRGLNQEIRLGIRIPMGQGLAGRVAEQGQPLVIDHVDALSVVSPILLSTGVKSMVGVPMFHERRVIGVMHVGTLTSHRFTTDDVELLQLVADRASLATQARLSLLDRATTVALQRSLLPNRLPTVAGIEVAARYLPGDQTGIGGDWYDLFPLPSGLVGIVIGDVAGNGLHAAVVMGRIRSALRAYALEFDDPADVLVRLDRKMQLFEPGAMATALYATLDPATGAFTASSAGHLPPVTARDDGRVQVSPVPPNLPLGAYPGAPRSSTGSILDPGSCLFLYTDGLVERRGRALSGGIDLLIEALTCAPPDTLCTTAMAHTLGDQPTADDIAVLALRWLGPPASATTRTDLTEATAPAIRMPTVPSGRRSQAGTERTRPGYRGTGSVRGSGGTSRRRTSRRVVG